MGLIIGPIFDQVRNDDGGFVGRLRLFLAYQVLFHVSDYRVQVRVHDVAVALLTALRPRRSPGHLLDLAVGECVVHVQHNDGSINSELQVEASAVLFGYEIHTLVALRNTRCNRHCGLGSTQVREATIELTYLLEALDQAFADLV